jgi:hypothetical protein
MAFGRNKEIEKRMLIKQTINSMNKQIQKLEEQKEVYLRAGKEAKERGLEAQYNLALSGLKMTMAQQKRVYEMKLNFEITSQMKDMTVMTTEFLKGMSSLSKDMVKLSKEKDFKKVEKQFAEAMVAQEIQTMNLENFMDNTQSAFESGSSSMSTQADNEEIEKLMIAQIGGEMEESASIESELEALKKQMGI